MLGPTNKSLEMWKKAGGSERISRKEDVGLWGKSQSWRRIKCYHYYQWNPSSCSGRIRKGRTKEKVWGHVPVGRETKIQGNFELHFLRFNYSQNS